MEIKLENETYIIDDDLVKLYEKYYKPNILETIGKKNPSLDDMLNIWGNNEINFLHDVTKLIEIKSASNALGFYAEIKK